MTMRPLKVCHYKSPINDYRYLAVDDGSREPPAVYLYDGRQCYIEGHTRTRTRIGRAFYNAVVVRFLDNGSALNLGLAQFEKKARPAPLPPAGDGRGPPLSP